MLRDRIGAQVRRHRSYSFTQEILYNRKTPLSRQQRFAELKTMPPRCVPVNGPILWKIKVFAVCSDSHQAEKIPLRESHHPVSPHAFPQVFCRHPIDSPPSKKGERKREKAGRCTEVHPTDLPVEGQQGPGERIPPTPAVPPWESSTDPLYRNVGPISRSPCLTSNSVVSFDQSHGSATWLVTD